MATVLYGWELGANLGHLVPLSRIASKLSEDGHRAVFAVLDLGIAEMALGPGSGIVQAPVWPSHRHFGARSGALASYADILSAIGFGDPAKLSAMIGAWTALVDLIKPDVVVADHSPGLEVALYERGPPIVAVGSGFTMPPLHLGHFPPLRGDSVPAMPEPRLLEGLRRAQAARGRKPAGRLLAPFHTKARVVFGLPELDPYRSFRQEPMASPPGGLPPPQPWLAERRLFVYVGGDAPDFEILAQALSILPVPVEAFFRGQTGPVPEFLRMRGMTVHEAAPPLVEVLSRCSHILTQGGAMTAAAAFTAGRPQLVMPGHDEAELNLAMLKQHGVAAELELTTDPHAVARDIAAFMDDPGYSERAQEIARRIAARTLPDGTDAAAGAVRAALG
jgi:rhamnosyltransferase subunit B